MNLADCIAKYAESTGDTVDISSFELDTAGNIVDSVNNRYMKTYADGTFFVWGICNTEEGKFLHLFQMFGLMKVFSPYIKEICKINEVEVIVFVTQRNPAPMIRKWKCELLKDKEHELNGKTCHVLKGNVANIK